MVNGIESTSFSSVQGLRALNAFRIDEKIVQGAKKQIEEAIKDQTVSNEGNEDVALRSEISLHKANEIKNYAQLFDMNVSNSDINYALTYGRSVIVDYSA